MEKNTIKAIILAIAVFNLSSICQTVPTNGATPFRINRPVNNPNGDAVIEFGDSYQTLRSVYGGGFRISTWNGKDALNLQEGTGNVGIGLTSPTAKLDVNGQIKSGSVIAYGTPSISGYTNSYVSQACGIGGRTEGTGYYSVGTACIENSNGNYNIGGLFWSQGMAGNRYGVLAYANGGSHSYPAGQWAGAFMGNTYVERDLTIGRKIKMKNWSIETPDYIFAKDYHLPSLGEVKNFIDINKHLPGIPSAAEMKKDGVDIAELNMTLLKKVEEMTLYLIDQKKTIETQNSRISELEKSINLVNKKY